MADVLNDIAFFFDLLAPHFPQALFAFFACTSALFRSIVGVAGGATRTAIVQHQARRDNLADVAAKDGSQETVVNLVSLFISMALLPIIDGHFMATWFIFIFCTFGHLFSNYKAVNSLQFDTLNQNQTNKAEPILHWNTIKRYFGCKLENLPKSSGNWLQIENAILVYDFKTNCGWICLSEKSTDQQHLSAVFYLEYFAATGK